MRLLFSENIKVAFSSIKANAMRTVLTALIIAIGIWALVGILTAIDALKFSISSNFAGMGANTFTIRNRGMNVRIGGGGKKAKIYPPITYYEAKDFKEKYKFPATVAVSTLATFTGKLQYQSTKSNPNIQVFGVDENYLITSGYEIDKGRNFSSFEVMNGVPSVLIGSEVYKTVLKNEKYPVGKEIRIGSAKYTIVGVLKTKGTGMGFGGDKICLIPIQNARSAFPKQDATFTISVFAPTASLMDAAISEATGLFRQVRKVAVTEEDNFEITKSDSLANLLIGNIQKVTMGATLIGIITLLGAAIGLMNIMLVSVTERTREIGIRKSLGATSELIRNQFLTEAVVICLLGGFLGIILGVGLGNLMSVQLGVGFYMPWKWVIGATFLCVFVGLLSGIIPATRAAKLDPIESLRYE
ncbi:MAG: ABC transporter permease [Bacteroidia bacterium]